MPLQTRKIGRIPVYINDYDPGRAYQEKNRVTLYGSEFQAAKNNPAKAPLTYNPSTHEITEWNVLNGDNASPTGEWYIISNGTDSWLASHKIDDIIASITSISLSGNPSVIYAAKNGQTVSLLSKINTIGTISSHKILKGSTIIASGTGSILSGSDPSTNTTSDITYTTEAVINGVKVSQELTVDVRYPIYFGAAATWDAINNDSHKASARISPVGSYSISVSQTGASVFFNVPSEMSITKATVSGLDIPFKPYVSKTIDGKSYKSYESANTYTEGTLNVVIVS
jgi:hypothetical protein